MGDMNGSGGGGLFPRLLIREFYLRYSLGGFCRGWRVETKKNKSTTLRKGTFRSFIIHLLDNMLCGSRDLTHTVERCDLQLKGVAHSREMWLTAGRCGSQQGDMAHSWEKWLTAGRSGSQLVDGAHSWQIWLTCGCCS